MKQAVFLLAMLAGAPAAILADVTPVLAQEIGWIADATNGCRVHDPEPQPDETIVWDGSCVNGMASGKGALRWLQKNIEQEYDEGIWRNGMLNGHGTLHFASGASFEGQFVDDKPNGYGVYIAKNGLRFAGPWKQGCFDQDGHQAALAASWEVDCGFSGPEPQ